jgi:hypothetical protein
MKTRPKQPERMTGLCVHLVIYSVCITWDPYPENGAQRRLGAENFLCLGLARRGGGRFALSLSTYLFGVNGL